MNRTSDLHVNVEELFVHSEANHLFIFLFLHYNAYGFPISFAKAFTIRFYVYNFSITSLESHITVVARDLFAISVLLAFRVYKLTLFRLRLWGFFLLHYM